MAVYIFTDGASKGNPGPGGWGAVVLENGSIREFGGRKRETTNNKMELTAAIAALQAVAGEVSVITLFTDSSYVINGITKWVFGWEKNNWKTKAKTDVLNADLWKELRTVLRGKHVEWKYVPGHSDVAGNERANDIAEMFALDEDPDLFVGNIQDYPTELLKGEDPLDREGNVSTLSKDIRAKKKKSGSAYSYVSLLDGKIEIHATWDECKHRVQGKPARFRKALSKMEEDTIVAEFKN